MRSLFWLSVLACTVACAPPEPITVGDTDGGSGVPEIRILFPDDDSVLSVDTEGVLKTLVVVDIINLEFAEPTGDDPVDGEGHYHLFVQETEYVEAPDELFFELESTSFTAGQRGIINVDLRQNDHSLLSDVVDDCICTAQVEFPVEGP